MSRPIDDTHRLDLTSWVDSAQEPGTDFPVQNLPYGVFRAPSDSRDHIGVAIGDKILDLARCRYQLLLKDLRGDIQFVSAADTLNPLMELGAIHWQSLRSRISALLTEPGMRSQVEPCLFEASDVEMRLPATIGDYTDFYASVEHATHIGSLFRPDNPLLPNYKWIPIGYHGRSSSVVISGTPIRRPSGQRKGPDDAEPHFEPCQLLDYELEVGFFLGGPPNELGETIGIADAEDRIFGVCLVNDWSARDLQAWEYQPLGPFLAKSFATSISPWVVTLEALAPYRCTARTRPSGDPEPLSYLQIPEGVQAGLDLELEVGLVTERMRRRDGKPHGVSRSRFQNMYWTMSQMLTHHASNGCNMRTGDLLASGTVSGETREEMGCLLEITRRGAEPLSLADGDERSMLEDGDEVILKGRCSREGFATIGFGECRGRIQSAKAHV